MYVRFCNEIYLRKFFRLQMKYWHIFNCTIRVKNSLNSNQSFVLSFIEVWLFWQNRLRCLEKCHRFPAQVELSWAQFFSISPPSNRCECFWAARHRNETKTHQVDVDVDDDDDVDGACLHWLGLCLESLEAKKIYTKPMRKYFEWTFKTLNS